MLTRREMMVRAAAAGALLRGNLSFAKASQPATAVNFAVPPNACDCHTHIFADPTKFPLWSGRAYTPEPALPEEMTALHRALHVDRVVIVTPSIYGTDNSATLDGITVRGKNARGIAVIDDKTTESDLDALGRGGFRGIRLNLATAGQNDPAAARKLLQTAAERMQRRNWHIQIYASLAVVAGVKDAVLSSPVPAVFDHFGSAQASLGVDHGVDHSVDQPGFPQVLEMVRSGKAYVKISGAYRSSSQAPDYSDVAPLAKALIAANADRILWGTDWPHPNSISVPGHPATSVMPLYQIDDGRLMNQLAVWAPDAAIRQQILVDNPARLYNF